MKRILPAWENSNVILVDPSIWKEYRDLRPVYRELTDALTSLGAEVQILGKDAKPLDIWIRDWGFVGNYYFQFASSYARSLYTPGAITSARENLDRLTGRHQLVPIVLDGGNLVHDGKVALLTEKVLQDNPQMARLEIEKGIVAMGFERVVFIPVEPEDVVGHADGIVRFLSPDVLLFSDYTGADFKDYKRRLINTLRRAKLHAELVPFPWFSTDEKRDGVWSAVGCYINFIQTAQGIVFPTFGHELDLRALGVLQAHTQAAICSVGATVLARLGGALNCVSLTM